MSLSVAGMLQRGETPNLEAAIVKDGGGVFERDVPERARLVAPDCEAEDKRFMAALRAAILYGPSWTLRGGTREILRGIVARGLGMR